VGNKNLLNVVKSPDMRRVVKAALDGGWEYVGITKTGHLEIRWPETGQSLFTGTTPGDTNAWKHFATDIKKVSGVVCWQKGNRKRSRKNPNKPDPQIAAARAKYQRRLHAQRQQEKRRGVATAEGERARRETEQLMRNEL
jgi:hypothetical protein